MKENDLYSHPGWADCTFEGARRQVLRIGLETTFKEKIEWLEETAKVAEKFHNGTPRKRSSNPISEMEI
jgi:hypothetical protein